MKQINVDQVINAVSNDDRLDVKLISDEVVGCPVCGDDYVHLGDPFLLVSDNYNAWRGRGDCLCIPCWCESGHKWQYRFGEHKGRMTFFVVKKEKYEFTSAHRILTGKAFK